MRKDHSISVIIPAWNEESSIGKVLSDLPEWIDETIVVDNGSTDNTSQVAKQLGATTVREERKGYGSACLRGIAELDNPDIVVFLDADYSDFPEEVEFLVEPIIDDEADIVIGSRKLGNAEKGALTPQQIFGNWLACKLIGVFFRKTMTDLGPFRAIRYSTLKELRMRDTNYGWTVEMQVKAAKMNVRYAEIPVRYRKRIGKSKVSGTLTGTISAGYKILYTIFKYLLSD